MFLLVWSLSHEFVDLIPHGISGLKTYHALLCLITTYSKHGSNHCLFHSSVLWNYYYHSFLIYASISLHLWIKTPRVTLQHHYLYLNHQFMLSWIQTPWITLQHHYHYLNHHFMHLWIQCHITTSLSILITNSCIHWSKHHDSPCNMTVFIIITISFIHGSSIIYHLMIPWV